MNEFEELIEAFTIFNRYVNNPKTSYPVYPGVHAEHHEISVGLLIEDTDETDRARLEELGWHDDEWGNGSWAHHAHM